jgi:hypothetical protein
LANSRKLGIAFELEEESEKIGVADKKEMKMMMNNLTHLKKSMNAFKVLRNEKEAKLNETTNTHNSLDAIHVVGQY